LLHIGKGRLCGRIRKSGGLAEEVQGAQRSVGRAVRQPGHEIHHPKPVQRRERQTPRVHQMETVSTLR